MTTKYAILATTGILAVWLLVVGLACGGIISSSKSDREVSQRASQLGMGAGTVLVLCVAPIWLWWMQSRRAAKLAEDEAEEDDEDRPRRRRSEDQDRPKRRRAD